MRIYLNHSSARSVGLSLALALSALSALPAAASDAPLPWQVNPSTSSLTFNTTKAGTAGVGGITETMRFSRYEGGLDAQGRIQFKIDLSSIDSGIGIRDERMQSLLFKVGTYPSVTFSAQIKPEEQKKMTQEAVVMDVEGQLTMAGQSKPVKAQLLAYSLNGKVMVSTRKPILIKADDFGLTEGVEALRAIVGLNFLSSTVPVTFQLELSKPAAKAAMSALPPSAW